jgi:hypothetical protein
MYVFHDSAGKILGAVWADSPKVELTKIPDGTTALYLDDRVHGDVLSNLGEYTIQNGQPVFTPIPDAVKLADAQAAKIGELDAKCNETILAGFTSSALGSAHDYDFDYEAQQNLSGMLSLFNADATIADVTWKTKDAGPLTHTKEQFLQLYKDGFAHKNGHIAHYWTLKAQVQAATTVSAVQEIVW